VKFDILDLHPDILKGIRDAGFEECTPIQEQSLPECLAGKDVIAQSQTGTGKTAVFLLTIFNKVMSSGPDPSGKPKALVMVPTRELCTQIIDDAVKLGKHLPIRSVAVYGGVEYGAQTGALKTGVDLVVATPGRMIDLYKSKSLSLDGIEIFIIDEADRMFDMGFAPDIMYIAGKLPKKTPRQTMLFSATIDSNVRRLAARYMKPDPVMIEIEPEQVTVSAIDQKIIYVSNEEKVRVLLTLLKRQAVERAIIFTNMKITAERLGRSLDANGLKARVLTGDVTQEKRQKIIDGMKAGTLNILVATDVAARGLHIEDVTHVINYDLPDDAANYVHRIGRTARAGKTGQAFSLACEDHVLNLPEIEKYIERKLEVEWIEEDELVKEVAVAPAHERPRRHDRDKKQGGQRHGAQRHDGPKHEGPRHKRPPFKKEKREGPPQAERQSQTEQKPVEAAAEGAAATAPQPNKEHKGRPGGQRRPRHGEEKKPGQPGRHRRPERGGPRGEKPNPNAAQSPKTPPDKQPHAQMERPHHARKEPEGVHRPIILSEPKEKKGGLLKRLLKFIKKPK